MPAPLSVRVSAGCTPTGNGTLTVSLINYPNGDTVTVNVGSYTASFTPGNYGQQVIYGVANGVYIVSASSTSEPSGTVYINNSTVPSLDKEIYVNCEASGSGTCDVQLNGVTVNPGDGETATTVTIAATGTGTLEYSLNGGAFQSSPTFTVTPGIYIATVRQVATPDCSAVTSFTITAPEITSVTGPMRDWLPVGLPIYYTFQSPDAEPEQLTVTIEVSPNGIDYNGPIIAGTLILTPDSNGQYQANIAPYLEATFNPGAPILSGTDYKLFRRYRLAVGKLSVYDGVTGIPELYTPNAHALYATELTPFIDGIITLTKPPYGFSSSNFPGTRTEVDAVASVVQNIGMPYTGSPDLCPKYPLHLYWLNRAGGWQSWVFDGKHDYGQETGEATMWQDENGFDHTATIEGVKEKVNVYSGFIPLASYDTVFGILSAIRVYHRDNGRFREVNLERGSFNRHKEGQRRKELNFSFTYAETLTVQNA